MPSKDYYLAVSLLNSKNVFDWTKAVDMLTDKELRFIRKVFRVEDGWNLSKIERKMDSGITINSGELQVEQTIF